MAKKEETFPVGARLILKDSAESVYKYSYAGSEAIVRDSRVDTYGFAMVNVEWVKNWRYNGQKDGWTYASHFILKELPPPPESLALEKARGPYKEIDLFAMLEEANAEESDIDQSDAYMDELSLAMDAASESEAFITIAVARKANPENPKEYILVPSVHSSFLSEESSIMLNIQLMECASFTAQEVLSVLLQSLNMYMEGDDNGL